VGTLVAMKLLHAVDENGLFSQNIAVKSSLSPIGWALLSTYFLSFADSPQFIFSVFCSFL